MNPSENLDTGGKTQQNACLFRESKPNNTIVFSRIATHAYVLDTFLLNNYVEDGC